MVEYRQYPATPPASVEGVASGRDGVWRVVLDKIPPAPPNHVRGLDRITIHEDADGDGKFEGHRTFLDGLNIATACARGRGGVYVLNPPYLLFYADKDKDDVPDGDPEVLLEGFGLEDTHSVVNSLRWGPDGWLYAAQGSTVTGRVRRPGSAEPAVHSMGQLIWRYHPESRRYEVFAEGGGNAFGVEIDAKGRIFSGHNGGDTRGFHYVQGGYFRKGFDKHGPLSNPYAFGYFAAMKHPNVPRFTHTFAIDEGGSLPSRYRGKLFGVAPLLNYVVMSEMIPEGSTFRTVDLGQPVTTTDPWFRPVDIEPGPDGALYVADWYDGQTSHIRNQEGQIDRTNGRVYRLRAAGAKPIAPFDLSKKSTAELADLLGDRNRWTRQTALRLIGDRKDPSIGTHGAPDDPRGVGPDRPRGALGLEPERRLRRFFGRRVPRPLRPLRPALDRPPARRSRSSLGVSGESSGRSGQGRARCRGPQPACLLGSSPARERVLADRQESDCPRRGRQRYPSAFAPLVGHRVEGRLGSRTRPRLVPRARLLGSTDREVDDRRTPDEAIRLGRRAERPADLRGVAPARARS